MTQFIIYLDGTPAFNAMWIYATIVSCQTNQFLKGRKYVKLWSKNEVYSYIFLVELSLNLSQFSETLVYVNATTWD